MRVLRLITGRAGSGKSEYCLQKAGQLAADGRRSVIVVPEQGSYAFERELALRLPHRLASFAKVRSFRSLCEDIFSECGGGARRRLNDAVRCSLVRRAVMSMSGDIVCFKRHIRDISFFAGAASVIGELKNAGVSPQELAAVALEAGSSLSRQKLSELAGIYRRYEELLEGAFFDQAGEITAAAEICGGDGGGCFCGVSVLFDGFSGFTEPQFIMISRLMGAADEICVTLCCDSLFGGGDGDVFSPIRKTGRRLLAIAKKNGLDAGETISLPGSFRYKNGGLRSLENFLAGGVPGAEESWAGDDASSHGANKALHMLERLLADGTVGDGQGVYVIRGSGGDGDVSAAPSPSENKEPQPPAEPPGEEPAKNREGVCSICGGDRYDEIRAVADEIAFLVREKNYSYGDIVVIARELAPYRAAISRTFSRFGIPYFCDAVQNLLYSPLTSFILAVLDIASGLSSERLFDMLKTSLCALSDEDAGELENYAYVWGIDRAAWHSPFTCGPGGFGGAGEQDGEALRRLEGMRAEILGWLEPVTSLGGGEIDGGLLIKAVFEVIERSGAMTTLENTGGDLERQASMALEMLDHLYALFAGEKLSAREVRETARLLAASTPVGGIPPALDRVVVGAADRIRADNPRAVFVVGLNDGVFPRAVSDTPLLTGAERELLARHDFELTRSFEYSAAMERLYHYRALTCSSERVYLCRALRDQRGSALAAEPKTETFAELCGVLPPATSVDPARYIVNDATAMDLCAERMERGDGALPAAVAASLCSKSASLAAGAGKKNSYSVPDPAVMRGILGPSAMVSATRLDTFSQCRFRYFLRYIMGIKPLVKAEISPAEAGNFVHGVIETAMRELGAGIAEAGRAALANTVERAAASYLERNLGPAAQNQPRIKYLAARLRAQTLRLLLQIQREQRQSLFRPVDFELDISRGGDVEPLVFRTASGEGVEVAGRVDRVDVFRRGGKSYIRVVDYKTGAKEFSLGDVYYGLSAQMLLYLFTIEQNGRERYGDIVPASAMYLPADPRLPRGGGDPESAAQKAYRMDGIVIDDADVIAAMERDMRGLFIPVKQKRDGSFGGEKTASPHRMSAIKKHIENTVTEMAEALYRGDVEACPLVGETESACDFCDYPSICRRDRGRPERRREEQDDARLFT
jgi:ATP-dependent helicase/nuclease subunit B